MINEILERLPRMKVMTIEECFKVGTTWRLNQDYFGNKYAYTEYIIPANSVGVISNFELNKNFQELSKISIMFVGEVPEELLKLNPDTEKLYLCIHFEAHIFMELFVRCYIEDK